MVPPCVEWWCDGNHTFQLLSKHGISLFGHNARMPDETGAKSLNNPPPQTTGGDHQDFLILRGWRLYIRTWNPITCPWMKQLMWLRIVHSGDWCLHLVLRSPSGACQKWHWWYQASIFNAVWWHRNCLLCTDTVQYLLIEILLTECKAHAYMNIY